jgi:hypothetical protein
MSSSFPSLLSLKPGTAIGLAGGTGMVFNGDSVVLFQLSLKTK